MGNRGNESETVTQARELIQSLFLEIHITEARLLGEGWDSTAVLINDETVFRFPKRPEVGWEMRKEVKVLELVRRRTSAATLPEFIWIVPRRSESPISVTGYKKIEGKALSDLSQSERIGVFPQIAKFLKELHEIPEEVLLEAQVPWFRWTGVRQAAGVHSWEAGLGAFIRLIETNVLPHLGEQTSGTILRMLDDYMADRAHFKFRPVLLHGDFSSEHILVNDSQDIGIIDFGDSGLGDPAYDVPSCILQYYPNGLDDRFLERNDFYHFLQPFHHVLYGLQTDSPEIYRNGLKQIERQTYIERRGNR